MQELRNSDFRWEQVMAKKRFGDQLVAAQLITAEALQECQQEAQQSARSLAEVLLKKNI